MKAVVKATNVLALCLLGFALQGFAAAITTCSTADFTAGSSNADGCFIGNTANDDLDDVSALDLTPFPSGGWSEGAKWDKDNNGLEGDFGNLTSFSIWPKDGGGFNWSLSEDELATFTDALFVVKQGNPNARNPGGWIAYLFEDLTDNSGSYYTQNSFNVNDYSHVSLYVRGSGGSTSVPEIDTNTAGLAFGLLAAFVLLLRERRFAGVRRTI